MCICRILTYSRIPTPSLHMPTIFNLIPLTTEATLPTEAPRITEDIYQTVATLLTAAFLQAVDLVDMVVMAAGPDR